MIVSVRRSQESQESQGPQEPQETQEPEVTQHDEITNYLNARYVSASESCWRLFEFGLQERSHHVERLPVHLANLQTVVFREDDMAAALKRYSSTQLTRYFEMCANDRDSNSNLQYIDFPREYVWKKKERYWKPRQRNKEKVISRLYACSPRDKERFYLRILLTKVPGATCYEDLRTVNNIVYASFEEAVRQLGLLDENDEFDKCLKEAVTFQMPKQL